MGVNRPAPQSIQSGMGTRELEKFRALIGYLTAEAAGFEKLYKVRNIVWLRSQCGRVRTGYCGTSEHCVRS